MLPAVAIIALLSSPSAVESRNIGTSVKERIQTSLSMLGLSHQALVDKCGRPDANVEGHAVWVYGGWTPSPRLGFTCAYFHEVDGARYLADGIQHVSASVAKPITKTLTAAQCIFGDNLTDADKKKGGKQPVPRDFSWVSGEKTLDVLEGIKAENVQHFAQQQDPRYVLTTCTVSGQNVYVFSRQIDGAVILPVFAWDVSGSSRTIRQTFDPKKLDVYSFSVGYCSKWQYTAGYSQEKIIGPGSYADTSLSDDKWVKLEDAPTRNQSAGAPHPNPLPQKGEGTGKSVRN